MMRSGVRSTYFLLPVLLAALVSIAGYAVHAAGDVHDQAARNVALDPVEERQAAMKSIASAAKTIAEMFERKREYDGAQFVAAAETIGKQAGPAMTALFPDNSITETSAALPEIRDEFQEFSRLAERLETYASGLADAARPFPTEMSDEMRMKGPMTFGNPLLGNRAPSQDQLDRLAAEHIFHLMLQTCASCHKDFRQKKR